LGIEAYPKVRVTTDLVILTTANKKPEYKRSVPKKGIQVLLVKRKEEPFRYSWTLPGGFVDYDKPLINTVYDKLRQKTGVKDIYVEQLYTYGDDVNRDPRDRVISIAYIALTSKEDITKLTVESGDSETGWFWVDTVRENNEVKSVSFYNETTGEHIKGLGFDHSNIVIDAINRIGNKILYTDIAFNLVGKEFTIKELQLAYETLAGRPLPSFRRVIMDKLEETGFQTINVKDKPDCFRPAKLYRKRRY